MTQSLITVGKVLKPLGLKGEVKVALLTDSPERFESLSTLFASPEKGEPLALALSISRVRFQHPFLYLCFEGLEDAESVSFLRGVLLQIDEADRVVLPPGRYFQSDLVGMRIGLVGGSFLGEVVDILETGCNDILVVKDDQKEYLIPAIPQVIQKVDLEARVILITPMEGLLEL